MQPFIGIGEVSVIMCLRVSRVYFIVGPEPKLVRRRVVCEASPLPCTETDTGIHGWALSRHVATFVLPYHMTNGNELLIFTKADSSGKCWNVRTLHEKGMLR